MRRSTTGETKYTAVNGTPALRAAIMPTTSVALDSTMPKRNLRRRRRQADPLPGPDGKRGGGGRSHHSRPVLGVISRHGDRQRRQTGHRRLLRNVGFKLHRRALEAAITPRTRWLILNTPSNPTGAAYDRAELEALGEVLLRHPHVHGAVRRHLRSDLVPRRADDDACGSRAASEGSHPAHQWRLQDHTR